MTLNSIIANFQTFKLADLLDIVIIAFLISEKCTSVQRDYRDNWSIHSYICPKKYTGGFTTCSIRFRDSPIRWSF